MATVTIPLSDFGVVHWTTEELTFNSYEFPPSPLPRGVSRIHPDPLFEDQRNEAVPVSRVFFAFGRMARFTEFVPLEQNPHVARDVARLLDIGGQPPSRLDLTGEGTLVWTFDTDEEAALWRLKHA